MDGLGPDWKGLLKWSIANSDGTQAPRDVSDEDRRFFSEAMQAQTVDVIKRMKEISTVINLPGEVLEAQGITAEELEGMLEELQEHVESIDMANDLHAIGGLVPILNYLKNPNAGIRAQAAEVVSTIVQNNPRSQQQVIECNGLENLLVNFNFDDDIKVRTKALGAISSLIRHNEVATDAFRLSNGYAGLRDALASEDLRFQRGSGKTISEKDKCGQCKGQKVVQDKKLVEVHVEKGMQHGQRIGPGSVSAQIPPLLFRQIRIWLFATRCWGVSSSLQMQAVLRVVQIAFQIAF